MKDILIRLRNNIIGFLYKKILRKIFFRIDEEKIHNIAVKTGKILGSSFVLRSFVSVFFNFSDPALAQNILGIDFKNPVGLAAGFDKNANLTKISPYIGFGFIEVGSATAQPCAGNIRPRIWRLPRSGGIVVNYGLNNDGCKKIARNLIKDKNGKIPIGVSIAKTNSSDIVGAEDGVADYLKGVQAFLPVQAGVESDSAGVDVGDYLAINISCPNAYGGRDFADPERLEMLFEKIDELNIKKPIFLKMPPDLSWEKVDKIVKLAEFYHISGFICSNLTKNREILKINPKEINLLSRTKGGISGKPVEDLADQLIAHIYKKTQGKKIIIGCGGIFSGCDAYKKIRLGASLVQLITGIIFEGPQVISQINLDLCRLLKKDGFTNINQAVGADFK